MKKPKDIIKLDKLSQGALNKVPKFYDSIVNNPLVDLLKNRISSKRFFRFVGQREFDVTIPKREFINPPGINVAGTTNFSFAHNSKRQVFPFVYAPLLETLVAISGVRADSTDVYVDVSNFNTSDKTIKLVVYLYELFE